MSLTYFLIVAQAGIGTQVKDVLHGTGKNLLVQEVVDMADCAGTLPGCLKSWRPQVLLAQKGAELGSVPVPVVWFDPNAFDPSVTADTIIAAAGTAPEPAAQPRPQMIPSASAREVPGIAVGFQGIKGGVGTTTIACAIAAAARRAGRQVAVLDFDRAAGDCALTLRARGERDNPHLYLSDDGILVVRAPADLNRVWNTLAAKYDVIVVDAGRVGEQPEIARALSRFGVQWFLVCSPEMMELLDPGRYPGFRILLNRERARRWWQWNVAGALPDDALLTDQINRGTFGADSSPFVLGAQEFTSRLMVGEVV